MLTGEQVYNEIIEFYKNKKDIYDFVVEDNDLLEEVFRFVHVSYKHNKDDSAKNRVRVSMMWDEKDGEFMKYESKNCVYKIDMFGEYRLLEDDELKLFDIFDFEICDKASKATKQEIYDWFGREYE